MWSVGQITTQPCITTLKAMELVGGQPPSQMIIQLTILVSNDNCRSSLGVQTGIKIQSNT